MAENSKIVGMERVDLPLDHPERTHIKPKKKTKCKNYSRYKGIHKPHCLGGPGCDACWEKYHANCEHPFGELSYKIDESFIGKGEPIKLLTCNRCKMVFPNWQWVPSSFLVEKLIEVQTKIEDLEFTVAELQRRLY